MNKLLSGIILLTTAQYVNNLLDYEKENDAKSGKIYLSLFFNCSFEFKIFKIVLKDIYALTFIFVIINIISATQDIVLGTINCNSKLT